MSTPGGDPGRARYLAVFPPAVSPCPTCSSRSYPYRRDHRPPPPCSSSPPPCCDAHLSLHLPHPHPCRPPPYPRPLNHPHRPASAPAFHEQSRSTRDPCSSASGSSCASVSTPAARRPPPPPRPCVVVVPGRTWTSGGGREAQGGEGGEAGEAGGVQVVAGGRGGVSGEGVRWENGAWIVDEEVEDEASG